MNNKGQFTDLFLFMIVALIILFVSGLFIYMGLRVNNQLDDSFTGMGSADVNYTEIKDDTFGDVNISYGALYWLTILMIVGMLISIFIGSYMVTTRPIFFVPYIFIVIIAILVSVGISNAYQTIAENETLASTFSGFVGSNFIMYNLPIWIVVIGFVGGLIMFVRMKSQEVQYGYGG
ncbi:MAG: hypothetical protein KAJ49_03420 [Arcobacteraceae bacterium]|nr:hypothetical protein [Arcobacteraceae bacterium]